MILSDHHIETIQTNSVYHIIQTIEQYEGDAMFIAIGLRAGLGAIGFGIQSASGLWLATASLDSREEDRPTWRTADWGEQNGVIRAVNPWDGEGPRRGRAVRSVHGGALLRRAVEPSDWGSIA